MTSYQGELVDIKSLKVWHFGVPYKGQWINEGDTIHLFLREYI